MTTTAELQPAAAETCAPEPHVWVAHMRGGEPVHVEICMGCGQFNWDGLREQVAALITADRKRGADATSTTDHPEDTCGRCGGPNIPWCAPSPLWNEVMRGGDINATDVEMHHGIVCPTCFAILAQEAGVADLWRLSAERVHVPLATVTPSGRTWNERTWLWDDAPTSPRQATEAEVRDAWSGGPLAEGVLYPQLLDAPDLPPNTFLAVSFDRDGQVLDAVKLTGIDDPS